MRNSNFKIYRSEVLNLDGKHMEIVLHKVNLHSILCDIVTEDKTIIDIFLHRNIVNRLLAGKITELIIQYMDDASVWGAVTSRW